MHIQIVRTLNNSKDFETFGDTSQQKMQHFISFQGMPPLEVLPVEVKPSHVHFTAGYFR